MEINKARAKMREKVSPTETSKTTEASGIRKIQQLKESVAGAQKNVPKWFQNFTGHDLKCLTSFQNFVDLMHRPTDSSSLGVGRALFGLMMLIDIPEERSGGDLDLRWGEPRDCRFPLFPFLSPLTLPKMGIVYLIMWMGALGIAMGYEFKKSCLMFVVPYWYIFFLDKTAWNNHSYLYGLIGTIMLFIDAQHSFSIDARRKKLPNKVPFWNYFLLKFQFVILYFMAGLKKTNSEWLSAYTMTNLSYHWVFSPFRTILGPEMTDTLIIHWFTAVFDLTVAFFLIWQKSRSIATLFAAAFHLMNSRLFSIGMFPWVCLVELPLFYEHDWPRTLWRRLQCTKCSSVEKKPDDERILEKDNETDHKRYLSSQKQKLTVSMILCYCSIQLFLPYSHFITKGYNNWVDGAYGYSWDMMVNAWDTTLISIKIVDNGNGKIHFLEPMTFTDSDRFTKYPDMTYQYAQCINKNLKNEFRLNDKSILTSDNFSIYFDVWCSLNGRFQQRILNPTVDLLKTDWHPLKKPVFTLPLLKEYNHFRKKINKISDDVFSWSNYTDVLFMADFPGLALDNYIAPELGNVTLTVLEGAVRFQLHNRTKSSSLSKGQSIHVKSGVFHQVSTISETPACYMYTYVNTTRQMLGLTVEDETSSFTQMENQPKLPIWNELMSRWENYKKFFIHVGNSLLFEFYSVPMPRRLRETESI